MTVSVATPGVNTARPRPLYGRHAHLDVTSNDGTHYNVTRHAPFIGMRSGPAPLSSDSLPPHLPGSAPSVDHAQHDVTPH